MPEFGFKARVPLLSGKLDRTEVDMRLGPLLVEAKLTESDFQMCAKAVVESYRDFAEVFDRRLLPVLSRSSAGDGESQTRDRCYCSYQLIRNVLAAQANDCAFCVLCDARRPDLMQAWYEILRAVKPLELRLRCKVLTWQEMAAMLPSRLQNFLEEKYGIIARW